MADLTAYSLGSFEIKHENLFLLSVNNFELPTKGLCLLSGLNGSGKTSLLSVLAERLRRHQLKPKISYMSALHVYERAMPISAKTFFSLYADSSWADVDNELFSHLKDKSIAQMSSGEFQALLLLAHLHSQRDIYIFDEPFSHLNPVWSEQLSQQLVKLSQRSLLIVACHHLEEFSDVKKTTLQISDHQLEVRSA